MRLDFCVIRDGWGDAAKRGENARSDGFPLPFIDLLGVIVRDGALGESSYGQGVRKAGVIRSTLDLPHSTAHRPQFDGSDLMLRT